MQSCLSVEKVHVPIFHWAQWEPKTKEELFPVFLVSFSGQLYTQNTLLAVSWCYAQSCLVATLGFLLPPPLSFSGTSGTFAFAHTVQPK